MKTENFYTYVVESLFNSTHLIEKGTRPSEIVIGGNFHTPPTNYNENYSLSFDFITISKPNEVPDLTYSLALLQRYHTSSMSFICFHSQFPKYVMDNFGVLEDEVEFIWERLRKRIIDTILQDPAKCPMLGSLSA